MTATTSSQPATFITERCSCITAFLNLGNPHNDHLPYLKIKTHFFDIHLGKKYSKHFKQFESAPISLFPGAATQLAGAGPI